MQRLSSTLVYLEQVYKTINNLEDYWSGLVEGRNGANLITKFDTEKFATKFACEVKNFNPEDYVDKKAARRMDPYTQYALATATMAIQDSEIDLEKVELERFGVIFGSGIGGMDEKRLKLSLKTSASRNCRSRAVHVQMERSGFITHILLAILISNY